MTPISPQDRNKAIGLIVAVVFVFGFAFWRIQSMSAPSAPPTEVHIDTPPPVVSTGSQPSNPPAGGIVEISVPATAALINPFRTVLSTKSAGGSSEPTYVAPRPPSNLGSGTFPPIQPPAGQLPPEMSVQPKLIGAVTGGNPVAIFSVGGKEVILHVGEKLDTGEVLESVRSDSAVLRKNGKKTLLSVGSAKQN